MSFANIEIRNTSVQKDFNFDTTKTKNFINIPVYPFGSLPTSNSTNARQANIAFEQSAFIVGVATPNTVGQLKYFNGTNWITASGDVFGPNSSLNNQVAVFDGLTGKIIKTTLATIDPATGNFLTPGTVIASNISGVNTGDVTLVAVDSAGAANANAAFLTGQVLNLRSATIAFPGVVNTTTQSFLGAKIFNNTVAVLDTTSATVGVYYIGTTPFLYNFSSGGVTNLFVGGAGNFTTSGGRNIGLGLTTIDSLTTGNDNVVIGWFAGTALTTGASNFFIGTNSGPSNIIGDANIGIGNATLFLSTNSNNIGIGHNALTNIVTGSGNVAVGHLAGSLHTLGDSNNIDISNVGVATESGAIRIGTFGTQTTAFVQGVASNNTPRTLMVVTPASGKLEYLASVPGTAEIDYRAQITVGVPQTFTAVTPAILTLDATAPSASFSVVGNTVVVANTGGYMFRMAITLAASAISNWQFDFLVNGGIDSSGYKMMSTPVGGGSTNPVVDGYFMKTLTAGDNISFRLTSTATLSTNGVGSIHCAYIKNATSPL